MRPSDSARTRLTPRLALVLAAIAATSVLAAAPGAAASAARTVRTAKPAPYLLALGDSLAAGYQPAFHGAGPPLDHATGEPDLGYPGSYAADLASARGGLHLVDLACPGETTRSMTATPAERRCATTYRRELDAPNQEAAALAFLAAHRHQVALVTIDLGANDLDGCVVGRRIDAACLARGDADVAAHLPGEVATLRAALSADDPGAHMIGMNYYDPFLAAAYVLPGATGAAVASLSLSATDALNAELALVYHRAGLLLADVAGAFKTNDLLPLRTIGGRRLPLDVATVCRWTWMCPASRSSAAADIHANTTGYAEIAAAFVRSLPAR